MTKARPKTGDKRQTRQPLKIDRLPLEFRDEIRRMRTEDGMSWQEIEEISPKLKFWEIVQDEVKQIFPGLKLPHSNLQRWYDLRIEQVLKETLAEGERARAIADAFSKRSFDDLDEAVKNALAEQVFMIMRAAGEKDEKSFRSQLLKLGLLLTEMKKAEAKKRQADIESKRVALLEEEAERKRKQFEKATNDAAKKITKGESLTIEDINRIRERTFGLPPVQSGAAARHSA